MKTKPILSGLVALSVMVLTLPSCQKDSAESKGMALKVQGQNKTFSIPVGGNTVSANAGSATVTWDEARMIISSVNLVAYPALINAEGSDKIEVSWQGPKEVDLFNMNEILGTIGLPAGAYGTVSYEVKALKSDAGNQPVFYLSGNYTGSSGNTVPIVVDIRDDISFTAQNRNVTIKGDSEFSGIIEVYLSKLFTKILPDNLDAADLTGGKIVISPDSNPQLYRLILDALNRKGSVSEGNGGSDSIR